jgi:hypothetical protein
MKQKGCYNIGTYNNCPKQDGYIKCGTRLLQKGKNMENFRNIHATGTEQA